MLLEREEKDWGKTQAKAVECCRETRRVRVRSSLGGTEVGEFQG